MFAQSLDEATATNRAVSLADIDRRLRENPARDSKADFRIQCAWCQRIEQEGPPDAPISHTICAECMDKHFPNVTDTDTLK